MDINSTNGRGKTALICACEKGYIESARLLTEVGADVSTAIVLAAENDRKECLKLLIESGADVKAKGDHGDTALILANLCCMLQSVRFCEGPVTCRSSCEQNH